MTCSILGYGRGAAPYPSPLGYAGAIAPYTGERVLVTGKTTADHRADAVHRAGRRASAADQSLTVTGSGTLFNVGEVLILDSEQMLVEQIIGYT